MDSNNFPPSSTVKRKPLSARFQSRDARSSGMEEDAFPLVPLQSNPAEVYSPNPDHMSTSYRSSKSQHAHRSFDHEPGTARNLFPVGSRYSKLPPDGGHVSASKSLAVAHDSLLVHPEPRKSNQPWNSTWLSSPVLGCFIALWLVLLAGLLILWHFATIQNGISTRITNNHYAWTYGPTALFVLIGLALAQVDYVCRILTPWRHLRNGPARARSSLLLDYISPLLLRTLVSASMNGDWAVLASGLSILILRIVIVFSTGLLVLTPTIVSMSVNDARIASKFVGTDYVLGEHVRTDEIMEFYGIQERGMNHLYGTTDTVAYETLDPASVTANATVTATVNGLFPYFDCEIVKPQVVAFDWENDGSYPYADTLKFNMTMTPTRCPGELITFPTICQPTLEDCQQGRSIYSDDYFYTPYLGFNPNVDVDHINELDPCNSLYKLSITEMEVERIDGPLVNTSSAWNVTMTATTGIVCTVGYTVDLVNVTVNMMDLDSPSSVNTSSPLGRVMDFLPGYSRGNFTESFSQQTYTFSLNSPSDAPHVGNFAKMLASLGGGSGRALLNDDTLKAVAERAGKGVGVLIADHYVRQPDSRTIKVTERFQEPRLVVRPLSVWVMSAGFVILALLAFCIRVWRPRDVISRNPNAIATYAAILAGSHDLQKALRDTGPLSDHQLKATLEGTVASSQLLGSHDGRAFSVEVFSSNEGRGVTQANTSHKSLIWWRPMSTRIWFMVTATWLPAVLIVSLEILQRKSDAHDGLAEVSSTSLVERSLPLILASTLLISVAMMYDAIYFAATTLAPYQALVQGSAAPRRSLCSGLSGGNMPFWSRLEALLPQSGVASLAMIAAATGSFLTIVGSGLYTIDTVQVNSEVAVTPADSFVPTFNTSTDGGAGAMFNLIQHNNASYPALTYDELAFPRIDTASLGKYAQEQLRESGTVMFTSKLPAIRASLNCTLVPQDTMVTKLYYYKTTTCPTTTVSFNASLPDSCPNFLDTKNQTATKIELEYAAQFACSNPDELPAARGAVLGDSIGSQATLLGAPSNPPECPSLAFIFGYWLVNDTSTSNITAMTCIQGLEEVHAEATFEASQTGVQVKTPPVADETTARWLQAFNSTYWFTKYGYFQLFNDNGSSPDYFYSNVFNGPGGIPPNELVGPANVGQFINSTQHMYRRYMAQLVSSTMRQNLDTTDPTPKPTFPATVSDPSVLRVKQNGTSKLVLQVFLGIMLICGILVYVLQDMRHVLPHSPWSIAGLMSLLAGAEVIERKVVPPGAEFMDGVQLAKVFEGYVFSLGWWNTGVGTGYVGEHPSTRFGIDIGQADASAGRRRTFSSLGFN